MYVGNHKQIGHGRNWGRGVISGPKVSDVDAWCAGTAAPSRRYLRTCRVKAGVFSNVSNPDAGMMKITYEQAAGTAAPSTGNSGNSSSSSGNSTTGDASSSTGTK